MYFECQSQAQINVRIAWGRAFSVKSVSNRTCGSIRCGDPLGNEGADKSAPLSPDYLRLCTRKLQALPHYAALFLSYFILNITCTPNRTPPKNPLFIIIINQIFFCFVFLQSHFRQRDPRKFIMLIIRVSCNQSSSFIIKAIPKIKLHPVSQFFLCTL